MKRILLLFFLSISLQGFSQIVNIPDPVFKAMLVANYDQNNDNEIQVTEALTVAALSIRTPFGSSDSIYSLEGIRSFANLQDVSLAHLPIRDL